MSVLLWIALLVGLWCVASVVSALALGRWLRRRAEATDPAVALRPLDTGPLRLWLGELPTAPDSPADLARRRGFDGLVSGLPSPRTGPDAATRSTSGAR